MSGAIPIPTKSRPSPASRRHGHSRRAPRPPGLVPARRNLLPGCGPAAHGTRKRRRDPAPCRDRARSLSRYPGRRLGPALPSERMRPAHAPDSPRHPMARARWLGHHEVAPDQLQHLSRDGGSSQLLGRHQLLGGGHVLLPMDPIADRRARSPAVISKPQREYPALVGVVGKLDHLDAGRRRHMPIVGDE